MSHFYVIGDVIEVLPDDNPEMPHSVVKSCTSEGPPQPAAISANPNWRVVAHTSVIYESHAAGDAAPTATPSGKKAHPQSSAGAPEKDSTPSHSPVAGYGDRKTSAAAARTAGGSSSTQSVLRGSVMNVRVVWPLLAAMWMSSALIAAAM